jgi:lipopolysaccharide transport system permease protein
MRTRTFIDLLLFKTRANLHTEVSQYYLNYLWWVINPLLTMGVFYVVFGIFLGSKIQHFVAFLLCGLTMWQWFARTVNNSASSIMEGVGLMTQIDIPKVFFPLEVAFRDAFKNLFAVLLLLVFLFFYPSPVTEKWLALPLLMAIQFLLNTAAAILIAALVPFIPDLKFIVSTGIELMFFGSGIFFSIEHMVLPQHRWILYANPMAGLIKAYRDILVYGNWPDWGYLAGVFAFSALLFGCAFLLVRKFDRLYPRVCLQ